MRTTIARRGQLSGIGLHKGKPAEIVFLPVDKATGIRFFKPDHSDPIAALTHNIATTVRGTNLSDGKRTIYTVEHILSACAGLGLDDIDILLNGEEPPAADGSALPIAQVLLNSGTAEKPEQTKKQLLLKQPLEFRQEQAIYRAFPAKAAHIKLTYSNPHPKIGSQTVAFDLSPETYLREIAPARTFGFKTELAQLKAAGLALGGSLENAIVIDENEFLSSEGCLRFPDEFARHKLLDLIGDLALCGFTLNQLSLEAVFTGHKSNVNFAKILSSHE